MFSNNKMTLQFSPVLNNKKGVYKTCTVAEYENICKKTKAGFELIPDDKPVKLYFDIDYKTLISDEEEYYPETIPEIIRIAKEKITEMLKTVTSVVPQFVVKTACSPNYVIDGKHYWCYSIHIIVANVITMKRLQDKMIETWNKKMRETDYVDYMPQNKPFFDTQIYDKNRKLRSAYCNKEGQDRPMILVEGSFADSVISVYGDDAVEIPEPEPEPEPELQNVVVSLDDNRFDIIKKCCDHHLFDAKVDTHIKWLSIGGMFLTLFPLKETILLWGLVSLTANRKAEYETKAEKDLQPFDNPEKVYNTLRSWAKEANPEVYKTITAKPKEPKEPKPVKEPKPIPADAIVLESDDQASDKIVELLEGRLIYIKGQFFFKTENIWHCDAEVIDSYLLIFIQKSNIRRLDSAGNCRPYAQNVVDANHIKTSLYAKIKQITNDKIYNKFHSTTKNRLCFRDGVLDFKAKKFYKWGEYEFEYYSTVKIDRDFAEYFYNPDRSVMKIINDEIIKVLFGKNEKGMQFLARALAGNCEDKNWASYLGKRNCGKGVLYGLLKFAFEGYVGAFVIGNVMYQRNSKCDSSEISRKLYWLLDYQFVRLAISQEVPEADKNMKLNGEMWKKMAGGKDEQIARRNYDRVDTRFLIDTTWMAMGNDDIIPDIEDVNEHRVQFNGCTTFITQAELDEMRNSNKSELLMASYKVKDETLKDKCETEEYANAIVMLIYEAWRDQPVETFVENTEEKVMGLREKLLKAYTITNNKDDYLLITDITDTDEFHQENKKKINTELLSFGVEKKQHKKKGDVYMKWCYYGLKQKEKEVVTDEEDIDDN